MAPTGPLRSYLQAVRGHTRVNSGPLDVARVVAFGLPLGIEAFGRLSRDATDYATEFILALKNVVADLPTPDHEIATQFFFGTGTTNARQKAALKAIHDRDNRVASSVPRLAQDRVIARVADDLLASDWFGAYRQELFGGRRRVSYGFALESLHLTLLVEPGDTQHITFTHDLAIRILKDRVRLIPRRYGWSGPNDTELPPTLADRHQRILFDTADGTPCAIREDEYAYYFIYLGRPYYTGEPAHIHLTQQFADPQQLMRPVFRYLAEQDGVWDLTLELVLPRPYADGGILFELHGQPDRPFQPRRWRPDEPPPATGIQCVATPDRVVVTWHDAAPRSGCTYFMGWERP